MQKITKLFWYCSGADQSLLNQCPSESSKYVGIGATVFFTGVFGALSAGYALFTVFENLWVSVFFGLLWGLMIFNLDRFIVSSMRKNDNFKKEFLLAMPRIILAFLISVVIAKPLELKIFDKEIQPELVLMEQEKFAEQEELVKSRFSAETDSLKKQIQTLESEILFYSEKKDRLIEIAQQEADGTGGSKKKNLGPIYKVKKADADKATSDYEQVKNSNNLRIEQLQIRLDEVNQLSQKEIASLEQDKINGLAARMEALSRITMKSDAVLWAHLFILLLFIAIETAPVFVKLISGKGPYDYLLHSTEHTYFVNNVEYLASQNSEAKQRTQNLITQEKEFVNKKLDQSLV